MSDPDAFHGFIHRLRAGEPEAAQQLVQQFEAVIRIEVRRRLRDPYLNRLFDSADVCQSVLASFFVRVTAGQFQLDQPDDLCKLLLAMARKKLASQARKQRTQARDHRRVVEEGPELLNALAQEPSPERYVTGRDLLEKVRALLNDEERRLADLRVNGRTWPEIAEELGGQAQARRRQLDRALTRACQRLGLEEGEDV